MAGGDRREHVRLPLWIEAGAAATAVGYTRVPDARASASAGRCPTPQPPPTPSLLR